MPYYPSFMPGITHILRTAVGPQFLELRGKAMEAVGLIGESVGKTLFAGDAVEVMQLLLSSLVSQCVSACVCDVVTLWIVLKFVFECESYLSVVTFILFFYTTPRKQRMCTSLSVSVTDCCCYPQNDVDHSFDYVLPACARISKALGSDFEPFLPMVITPVLVGATQEIQFSMEDADEGDVEGEVGLGWLLQ